ncbi:MAG: hypothetical protein ACREC6_09420 [Hyphomicrobiaceae bacterium]
MSKSLPIVIGRQTARALECADFVLAASRAAITSCCILGRVDLLQSIQIVNHRKEKRKMPLPALDPLRTMVR